MSKAMEKFKMQMWAYQKLKLTEQQMKGMPFLHTFHQKLEKQVTEPNEIQAIVEDLVKPNTRKIAEVVEIRNVSRHRLITSIKCPLCEKKLQLDRRWNAFLCNNGHQLFRWDVVAIKYQGEVYAKS